MKVALLISLRMSLTVFLLFLLLIPGVVAQDGWAVNYNSKSVCTLKGSALSMECTYTPPSNHSVQKAFWTKELVTSGSEPPDLSDDPEYRGRVQYLGDEHRDCSLRFKNVTETDQSKYYFIFITNQPGGKYQGAGGVDLSVTDLQVEVPERVIAGDNVTLTCKTTCSLTVRPTFTWYRNGSSLSSSTDQLHLQPVSSDNKDRYHCAVLGQNSPEVTLNVRYGPKNISVSISPSGKIVEGSSVTLTCSSDANPPVQNYTWLKGTSLVAEGETYTMKNISSVDSGEYKCRSSNEHGQKLSEALTLNVLHPPKNVSVSISPSGEIVEGRSVTLTCSSVANPPVQNYTWFKGTSSVGKGETYTMKEISSVDSGQYKCRSSNEHGEKLSEALTLNVLYPPKSVSVSISPSGEIVEGSSVNLTCSSDGNPPVEYNWFKGTSIVGKGETYTMKNISSVDSGQYKCRSSNEHGEKLSEALNLNVLYPPKNISVSISPSGEIMEGSSLNLTCSSDANPPVQNYTWFKGASLVAEGETYTMKNISSVDSGQYKCRSSNEHGEKVSEALTLNVLYPPKNISVSVSPYGEIMEGRSVTLTCSSDANPPVEYNWIKGTSSVGKGETYTMKNISSVDRGEYNCRSSNKHGEKLSEALTLNVLYLQVEVPERVIEGDEVTLTCKTTCSLTVTPTFTWYRNGSSLSSSTDQLHLHSVSSDNKDRYNCAVLGQNSPEVTLNVRYGPKSVSVSISPSGEIVEGRSVTLTCSSDANPPVQNYTWFKGASSVGKGETYTMNNISSVDSGEYKCRSSNEHGQKLSEALTLNVLYPPKNISVSVSPSGKIVEGSSVTLTCSSDSVSPVEYHWFKGTSSVAKGETYTMKKISSVNRGEYKCRSSNKHGEKLSEALTLNVLYPPKNVSASISPSGETAEGSSVNLTCSSDANPPVQNYTWFKEGGSSPVGSGHSYRALQRGSYYCEAQNEHGSQKSAAVTVGEKGKTSAKFGRSMMEVLCIVLGGLTGVVALLCIVFCVRRYRQRSTAACKTQGNQCNNLGPDLSNQDDVQYASVVPCKVRNPRNAENSAVKRSGSDEEVQYASIQHHRDKVVQKTEEDDVQYASVRFTRTGAANRPAVSTCDDSVIYSTMK
ncbi:B-cell receptor CD22-like isoform X3 [Pygocentrus nattereri]|uniref:B-cell receptor CD22-like isoform X3 n=1 Tax=Pygocentrus nattereri TaxID=42514 RepID=UPI001891E31C|nr:B-cell receptor CD22-like isoform X3 [Pygocentrus nattereri]